MNAEIYEHLANAAFAVHFVQLGMDRILEQDYKLLGFLNSYDKFFEICFYLRFEGCFYQIIWLGSQKFPNFKIP